MSERVWPTFIKKWGCETQISRYFRRFACEPVHTVDQARDHQHRAGCDQRVRDPCVHHRHTHGAVNTAPYESSHQHGWDPPHKRHSRESGGQNDCSLKPHRKKTQGYCQHTPAVHKSCRPCKSSRLHYRVDPSETAPGSFRSGTPQPKHNGCAYNSDRPEKQHRPHKGQRFNPGEHTTTLTASGGHGHRDCFDTTIALSQSMSPAATPPINNGML